MTLPSRTSFLVIALLASLTGCIFPLAFDFQSPVYVSQVVLADFDGDGYPDAYVVITRDGEPYGRLSSYVLFNDGAGRFTDSGQRLEFMHSNSAAAGDLDGDGAIDLVANEYEAFKPHRNDGSGGLRHFDLVSNEDVIAGLAQVALADLDANGALDVFLAGCCGGMTADGTQPLYPYDTVWLNDGSGQFRSNGQLLSTLGNNAVALGDLNGDGFPDAFVATGWSTDANMNNTQKTPNTVWLNDGRGSFRDSGQRLGLQESLVVALGDLDGDDDLDAVVGNRGPDEVWFNDGHGIFFIGSQSLGEGKARSVQLADLDGDGDLDLLTGEEASANVWFNDGAGRFTTSKQAIEYVAGEAVAVGDLDGDGSVDVLVLGLETYQLWRNDGRGLFTADPRMEFLED